MVPKFTVPADVVPRFREAVRSQIAAEAYELGMSSMNDDGPDPVDHYRMRLDQVAALSELIETVGWTHQGTETPVDIEAKEWVCRYFFSERMSLLDELDGRDLEQLRWATWLHEVGDPFVPEAVTA